MIASPLSRPSIVLIVRTSPWWIPWVSDNSMLGPGVPEITKTAAT